MLFCVMLGTEASSSAELLSSPEQESQEEEDEEGQGTAREAPPARDKCEVAVREEEEEEEAPEDEELGIKAEEEVNVEAEVHLLSAKRIFFLYLLSDFASVGLAAISPLCVWRFRYLINPSRLTGESGVFPPERNSSFSSGSLVYSTSFTSAFVASV